MSKDEEETNGGAGIQQAVGESGQANKRWRRRNHTQRATGNTCMYGIAICLLNINGYHGRGSRDLIIMLYVCIMHICPDWYAYHGIAVLPEIPW